MKKKMLLLAVSLTVLLSVLCAVPLQADAVLVPETNLTIEEPDRFLLGIPTMCSWAQLKQNFTTEPSGYADSDPVTTGMRVTAGGTDLTVVISGDTNGDGKLSSSDYLLIKRHLSKKLTLTGAFFRAADINNDDVIRSSDYITVKKCLAGTEDLYLGLRILPGFNVTLGTVSAGGTVTLENRELHVSADPGYRLNLLQANGHDIYIADGVLSQAEIADSTVTAEFVPIQAATAAEAAPSTISQTFFNQAATRYGVTWRSSKEGTPVLKYLKDTAGTPRSQADLIANGIEVPAYTEEAMGICKNRAALFGPEPGASYSYIVGDKAANTYSAVCSLSAKPEKVSEVTFLHTSDTQDDTNHGTYWKAALDSAFNGTQPAPAFVVNTGDTVNKGGDETQWQRMLDTVLPAMRGTVLVPTAGNHDYWGMMSGGFTGCTYAHFNIDLPDAQSTEDGMYYSFDYGDVHMAVLNTGDSMVTGGPLQESQLNWLINDLSTTKQKWKIVALHNPLYSPGKYGSDPGYNAVALALRQQLDPVFSQYKVDLVLNGHDHCYSRSYPIAADSTAIRKGTETQTVGDISYLVKPAGPIHLESATAGPQGRGYLTAGRVYSADMIAAKTGFSYYSAITVKGNRLTVRFYSVNMETQQTELLRSWGIQK